MNTFDMFFVVFISIAVGKFLALYWLVGRWRGQVLPLRGALMDVMQYVPMLAAIEARRRHIVTLVTLTCGLGLVISYTVLAVLGLFPTRWIGAVWAVPVLCAGLDLVCRAVKYDRPHHAMLGLVCMMWSSFLALYSYWGKRQDADGMYLLFSLVFLCISFVMWVMSKGRDRYADSA